MSTVTRRKIAIGVVVGTRGLQGELKVLPLTPFPERFSSLPACWLERPGAEDRVLTPSAVRVEGRKVFLRCREIQNRDEANRAVGGTLTVPEEDTVALPEGMYFHYQVEGMRVEQEGRVLGRVVKVLEGPAYDLWEVQGEGGNFLLPAVREFVREVDLSAGVIRVDLPEGLAEVG